MNFKEELACRVKETQDIIMRCLPEEQGFQKRVLEAMNYSLCAGGKRLRPLFMRETYRMFGGEGTVIEPFMAAMEMVHTYSLVHDDLPAMDNDEYRRGRKTTHVIFGEAMAVLAGDALLNYAFETAFRAFDIEGADPAAIGRALQVFAKKAGVFGMIGGQTADILAEESAPEDVTQELLLFIHAHKTAALMQSAMMVGAILAGAKEAQIQAVEKIAGNVGIAFQIQDDILDVTGSLETLGKPVGSDEKNNKKTYVTINGIDKAKQEVERLSKEALAMMASFTNRSLFLEELITDLMTREK